MGLAPLVSREEKADPRAELIATAVRMVATYLARLSFCRLIQQIDRRCYLVMKEIFDTFYLIPYLLPPEVYSALQRKLMRNNLTGAHNHSSWTRSLLTHYRADLLLICGPVHNGKRLSCSDLHCPTGCGPNPDVWDDVTLLDKSCRTEEEKRREIVDSLTRHQAEMLLPYLTYHCSPGHMVLLAQKYGSKWTAAFCYEFHFLYDYLRQSHDMQHQLPVQASLIAKSGTGAACLSKMLLTPQAKIINAFQMISPFAEILARYYELDTLWKCQLSSIEILQVRGEIVHLTVTSETSISPEILAPAERQLGQHDYLAIKNGHFSAYVLTKLARLLALHTKIQVVTPRVMVVEDIAIMELPANSQLSTPLKKIMDENKKAHESHAPPIEAYAAFTAFSYMLGLSEKYVAYSDDGLFHLDYSKAYYKNKMRLANVIEVLDGRSSNYYRQFVIVTVQYLMMLRRHYKTALLFLPLLKIKREDIEARFQPRLDDEEAKTFYQQKLSEQADYAMRKWRLGE